MLYLLIVLFIGIAVFCFYVASNNYDNFGAEVCAAFSIIIATCLFITALVCALCYNSTASTAQSRLAVLQEQNEIVLAQVQPIVEQYAQYESGTLKEFKMSPEKVVALCAMYPELKSNEFFKAQIDIIVENQREIKDIKLEIASLNAYHLWLLTPIRY